MHDCSPCQQLQIQVDHPECYYFASNRCFHFPTTMHAATITHHFSPVAPRCALRSSGKWIVNVVSSRFFGQAGICEYAANLIRLRDVKQSEAVESIYDSQRRRTMRGGSRSTMPSCHTTRHSLNYLITKISACFFSLFVFKASFYFFSIIYPQNCQRAIE